MLITPNNIYELEALRTILIVRRSCPALFQRDPYACILPLGYALSAAKVRCFICSIFGRIILQQKNQRSKKDRAASHLA